MFLEAREVLLQNERLLQILKLPFLMGGIANNAHAYFLIVN
jgi:hypothetical protein